MKKDLLIQIDGKMPNLALRKLGGFLKERSHRVFYDKECSDPDHVYISCLFQKNAPKTRGIAKRFTCPVEVGGYGVNGVQLPDEIEHHIPDYEGMDYSFGYTCYDDRTEVLTKEGWKLFEELTNNDEAATLNKSGYLEYQKPTKIMVYNYSGKMLHFKNLYIDLLVTPNHRLYIKKHRHIESYVRKDGTRLRRDFELVEAEKASSYHTIIFKKDALWNGIEREYFYLPRVLSRTNKPKFVQKIRMDDWLEFLGYYLSEGSTQYKKKTRNYIVKISQKRDSKSWPKMKNCIERLGFGCYISPEGDFYINGKQLYSYLKLFGRAYEKYIPKEFKDLCSRQLKILFNAYVLGDGHIYKSKYSETSIIITSSKRIADDIQEILLKMGCCGDVRLKTDKGEKVYFKRESRYIKCFHNIYYIGRNSHYRTPAFLGQYKKAKLVHYEGKVYCCEVPNHIIYVRRNGFACWSGNSRGCTRNCPWCVVPKREGHIRDHAPISEFHNPDHDKLILFDNNLLALRPKFKEDMDYIEENNLKVCFCQGLDIRLVDEETAGMLAGCRYYSLSFKERRLYFAFDTVEIEPKVIRGVEILKEAGIKPSHLMFYMLCGFQEPYDFAQDWHRFKVLLELGVDPYVMKYNGRRDIRILNHFSRWVIKRDCKRKRPKFLRPHEWEELQEAISQAEMEIERRKW